VQDLGGRVEQGMRPTYALLQQREKDLLAELEAIIGSILVFRTRYDKGLCSKLRSDKPY